MPALVTEYFVAQAGKTEHDDLYRVGLPVSLCAEVITLTPEQICPLPPVHPAILGVVNWRGQLLWTLALDQWLWGKTSQDPNPAQPSPADPSPSHRAAPSVLSRAESRNRTALVLTQDFQARSGRRIACLVSNLEALLALEADQAHSLSPKTVTLDPAQWSHFSQVVPQHQLLLINTAHLFQPDLW